jgi:hypothetical protein
VVSLIGAPHHCKEGDWKTASFLYIISVWGWFLCYEHNEEQEQVLASNTGATWGCACQQSNLRQGTSWDITKHRFPTDILCLHKDLLFLLMFISKSLCRWYISTNIMFSDIIHHSIFI